MAKRIEYYTEMLSNDDLNHIPDELGTPRWHGVKMECDYNGITLPESDDDEANELLRYIAEEIGVSVDDLGYVTED